MSIKDISERAIALPFKITAYGLVSDTSSQDKIWADRVKAAINTRITERLVNVNYGTKISTEIFTEQSLISDLVNSEIRNAFTSNFPLLRIISIDTVFEQETNVTTVELVYELPSGQTSELIVGTTVIVDGLLNSEER